MAPQRSILTLALAASIPSAHAAYVAGVAARSKTAHAMRCGGACAVLNMATPGASADDFEPPGRRVGERTQLPLSMIRNFPPEAAPAAAADTAGYVFGRESVDNALAALRNGSIVLLTEDGEESTRGSLVVGGHVTPEQLQFFLEHTVRLQAALEPERYRAVYRSLRRIVLDNNNLAQPAISVSARNGGANPRNATHIARAVRALLTDAFTVGGVAAEPAAGSEEAATAAAAAAAAVAAEGALRPPRRVGRDAAREVATSFSSLVCPGAISLGCMREGGVLRRAGATEAAVEINRLAGLPAVGLHASLRQGTLSELYHFAEQFGIPVSSTADLVAYARGQQVSLTFSLATCAVPLPLPA